MKLLGKNKYGLYALIVLCFVCAACPAPLMNSYYIQQQNNTANNQPNPPGDFDDDTPTMPPLPDGTVNAFWVILPDGVIAEPKGDNTAHTQLAGKLGTGYEFSTAKFDNWKFKSNFSSSNVPEMEYSGTVTWDADQYNGENAHAGGNTISSMVYYRYRGKNPFGLYKNEKYPVYNAEGKPTGKKEALMTRFVFYRFTGKGGGVADLDNYIVVVDTYSKLVFAFAKPIKFATLVGQQVPTEWAPLDKVEDGLTAPDGRKYRFYEYDPAGYVTEDGAFHMTDAYKTNIAAGNYIPACTGMSPYLGCGGIVSYEEPLSGALTVSAKYLKNASIPDESWLNPPEFTWDIRSRAYSGDAVPEWDSLEKQVTNKNYHIKKGKQVDFTEKSKVYVFTGAKGPHMLELDSEITEVDNGPVAIVNPDDPVTKYGKPIVYLNYDSKTKCWTLASDATNGVYTNGTISFTENFTLTAGETKDFVLTLPGGSQNGGDMELCYELSWKVQ